ncbi:MAG: hypothetical protein OXC07_09505 [Kistimonas sp.]|nr:hypothetical protein [Kistimonas sp.]
MSNIKFEILVREYLNATGFKTVNMQPGKAVQLTFGDTSIYIENGKSIGHPGDILLLWEIDSTTNPNFLLSINSRYHVTGYGYFGKVEPDGKIFYFFHSPIPENVAQMGRQLAQFVGYVSLIKKELVSHAAS